MHRAVARGIEGRRCSRSAPGCAGIPCRTCRGLRLHRLHARGRVVDARRGDEPDRAESASHSCQNCWPSRSVSTGPPSPRSAGSRRTAVATATNSTGRAPSRARPARGAPRRPRRRGGGGLLEQARERAAGGSRCRRGDRMDLGGAVVVDVLPADVEDRGSHHDRDGDIPRRCRRAELARPRGRWCRRRRASRRGERGEALGGIERDAAPASRRAIDSGSRRAWARLRGVGLRAGARRPNSGLT